MVSSFISQEQLDVTIEDGKKEKVTFQGGLNFLNSANRDVRIAAADEVERVLIKHLDSGEHEINTILEGTRTLNHLRGITRPDLPRHLADDIDTEVVDVLIDTVTSNFNVSKRFYRLKSKILGIDKPQYFDRTAQLGELKRTFSGQESTDIVYEVMSSIDPEFGHIFSGFIKNGNIDFYPRQGKTSGGFCAGDRLSEPTYILLNHTGNFDDVRTLAHEVGHGINNELMKKSINELNFDVPMSTAEVASTFFEDFVLANIQKDITEEEELILRFLKLDQDIAAIHRQTAFYNFEKELHASTAEKGYSSKEEVGDLFYKHMESYLGETAAGSNNWWLYVGHFRSSFYVYSYASGLLISKAMQSKVKEDASFINKVKDFLGAGISDSPKNLFMKMGIDITKRDFWQDGLAEIEAYLDDTERLAKKLNKL